MFTLTVQKCYHPGMEITEAQYGIAPVLPVQRGNVKLELAGAHAILYVASGEGCRPASATGIPFTHG